MIADIWLTNTHHRKLREVTDVQIIGGTTVWQMLVGSMHTPYCSHVPYSSPLQAPLSLYLKMFMKKYQGVSIPRSRWKSEDKEPRFT